MYRSGKPLLRPLLAALALCSVAAPLPFHHHANAAVPAGTARAKAGEPLDSQAKTELLARLDALKARAPSLQADFSESRNSRLLKKPVASEGTIAFTVPNRFRREVKGSNPSLTVSNGKVLWLYYPNFKEAELYTLGQRAMFDDAMAALTAGLNFGQVERYYHLTATKGENDGFVITLTPKKSNLRRIVKSLTVHLDADLDVRRTEFQMPKGDAVVTEYHNVRRTSLPASTFEFTPPEGVNVSKPLGK
ncbi:MAG TPA: outer membrane lipoprotein carrier protein LolA [Chthoniobacteraceae bacterium]|nr:outer membrane lipoprotein carrier protein LolA [Chthoniobacteraceae bacterium]